MHGNSRVDVWNDACRAKAGFKDSAGFKATAKQLLALLHCTSADDLKIVYTCLGTELNQGRNHTLAGLKTPK